MPIPALDQNGLLPPGVHEATLEEVGQRFGQFQRSDRRVRLQRALEAYVAEARPSGLVEVLIVNGSFTTGKAQPEDVDVVAVLRAGVDLSAEFRPDQYNVVSAHRVRARHGLDVHIATARPESLQPWIDYFSQVRGQPGLRKGMVKVIL